MTLRMGGCMWKQFETCFFPYLFSFGVSSVKFLQAPFELHFAEL